MGFSCLLMTSGGTCQSEGRRRIPSQPMPLFLTRKTWAPQILLKDLSKLALILPSFLSGSARKRALLFLVSPCPGGGTGRLLSPLRICLLLPQLALPLQPELRPSHSVSETFASVRPHLPFHSCSLQFLASHLLPPPPATKGFFSCSWRMTSNTWTMGEGCVCLATFFFLQLNYFCISKIASQDKQTGNETSNTKAHTWNLEVSPHSYLSP